MDIMKFKSKPIDLKNEIRLKLIKRQQGEVIKYLDTASDEWEVKLLLKIIDELNAQKVKIYKEVQRGSISTSAY